MSERYDVIVIGVGAMGSASCFHLARRGASVLGLEAFSIPNAMGSSHGDSRIIRICYFEHPDYVPLLRRTYELWGALEGDTGRELMVRTGGLFAGPADGKCFTGTLATAQEHDLPHERLDHATIAGRFPQFTLPDDYEAIYEPSAGILRPERAICTHTELAIDAGAVIHGHEPVEAWAPAGDGYDVRTRRGTYQARRLVFCAGAWTRRLVGDAGTALSVSRQVLGWVQPVDSAPFRRGTLPIWGIDDPDGSLHYGFPIMEDRPGLKLARHYTGPDADPKTLDRTPRPEDEDDFRPTLARYLPGADGHLLSMAVCMYTNTPDGHFILDRHPEHEGVAIATGFSGHGFKFAPVVGEIMADLTLEGGTELPIGFLSWGRFVTS